MFSKGSIQWLEYLQSRAVNQYIQHVLNRGEKKIPNTNYKVDGFSVETNTIFEYLGCLWHACKVCFPDNRQITKHPRTGQPMEKLYALTMIKKSRLIELGYSYVSIWEHDWLKQVKGSDEIRSFIEQLDVQDRLEPRDSFYGGRTNACRLYYKIQEGETIKYM